VTEPRSIPKDAVVALLASALGQEKSDEVVLSTAHGLGIPGAVWTGAEVRAIVDKLARSEGLVGVVARFALTRGDVDRLVKRSVPPEGPPSSRARRPSPAPTSAIDLVGLLAPALGAEKARDATESSCGKLGFDARTLSRDEALHVLDDLTKNEGIVGVVARFAKARFLLTS
jgi:hypothetical protein